MTRQPMGVDDEAPPVGLGTRWGTALPVILLAGVLREDDGAFMLFKRQLDNEFVLGIAGVLSMMG